MHSFPHYLTRETTLCLSVCSYVNGSTLKGKNLTFYQGTKEAQTALPPLKVYQFSLKLHNTISSFVGTNCSDSVDYIIEVCLFIYLFLLLLFV